MMDHVIKLLSVVLLVTLLPCDALPRFDNNVKSCELLNIPLCKHLDLYGVVHFPSFLNIKSQTDARARLRNFLPWLKNRQCASYMQSFLCHVFVPPCGSPPPCRAVCRQVRDVCQGALKEAGWPNQIRCSLFPEEGMCLQADDMGLKFPDENKSNTQQTSDVTTPHFEAPADGDIDSLIKDIKSQRSKNGVRGRKMKGSDPKPSTVAPKPKVEDSKYSIILQEDPELIIHTTKPVNKNKVLVEPKTQASTLKPTQGTSKVKYSTSSKVPDPNALVPDTYFKDDDHNVAKFKIIEDHRKDSQFVRKTVKKNTEKRIFYPRRKDIKDKGDPKLFRGWADVQGQGAKNDYCRVIGTQANKRFLACARAGLDEKNHSYVSLRGFDPGHEGTWFMDDMDGDGRDDFCRCVGEKEYSRISCMKAGKRGFHGSVAQSGNQYTFTVPMPSPCHKA